MARLTWPKSQSAELIPSTKLYQENPPMEVQQLPQASDFLTKGRAFLEADEAEHNLLIGLAFNAAKAEVQPLFLLVLSQGEIVACAMKTDNRNIVLSKCTGDPIKTAEVLTDFFTTNKITLPGAIGPTPFVDTFAHVYCCKTQQRNFTKLDQCVFQLSTLKNISQIPSYIRKAENHDLELATKFMNAFIDDALAGEKHGDTEKVVQKMINDDALFVLVVDAEITSMACITRWTWNGFVISYVYTPKHLRGKGYASNMVFQLSAWAKEQKQFGYLFTDKTNPTSNKIYQVMGYEIIGESKEIGFAKT